MDRALKPCGWELIDVRTADTGDIVLAHAPRHQEYAAGVCVSGKTALLTKRGLVLWPLPFIAAWRCNAVQEGTSMYLKVPQGTLEPAHG